MKMNLQEKKMKRIAELLSGNLSYIAGENENGVNGEKAEFLRTSAAFLRKLGKEVIVARHNIHRALCLFFDIVLIPFRVAQMNQAVDRPLFSKCSI